MPHSTQHADVDSVGDALQHLAVQESVDGFTCAKTKQEVQARKQHSLEALPPVLVLHLKRFVYHPAEGTVKLRKPIAYDLSLEVKKGVCVCECSSARPVHDTCMADRPPMIAHCPFSIAELLSPQAKTKISTAQRQYKLFAIVYHHGKVCARTYTDVGVLGNRQCIVPCSGSQHAPAATCHGPVPCVCRRLRGATTRAMCG